MAIGKKLRFEILRRDGFRCQYCGIHATAPDVVLEVDHIDPRSKGGRDDPSNLITACQPCNAGKTDTRLDAPTVASPRDTPHWQHGYSEGFQEGAEYQQIVQREHERIHARRTAERQILAEEFPDAYPYELDQAVR